MKALGRLLDISTGVAPVDTQTAASTGKRVSLRNADGVTIVLFKAAGVGADDPVVTLREHNAGSGGVSQNLAVITEYHRKSATTLAGTELWARVTQSAAATATLTGEAAKQGIYVFEVDGTQLSDGFTHISLDVADTGAAGPQLGSVLYLLRDLDVQRIPTSLVSPQ